MHSLRKIELIKTSLIFSFLITILICLPVSAQDEHTVVLYSFETVSGDVVNDISDYGNDGTVMGPDLGDGKFHQGLVFGGSDQGDFVEIPDTESLDLTEGLTVEMWLFLNSEPSGGGQGVTKAATYKFGPRNNLKAELRIATTDVAWGSAVILSEQDLPTQKWIHIAATYDAESGVGKLYLDGEIDTEKDIGGGNIVPNDNVLWLGRGGTPFLDGILDELRISNIARSQDEIKMLMNLGIDGAITAVSPRDKLATTWGKIRKDSTR